MRADSPDELAAGFATLRRLHAAHLRACRWYVQRVAAVQGGVIVLCVALAAGALLIAAARDEPLRSIMRACAMLNGVTIALCIRHAFREIRGACREAADVRRALAQVEADAQNFEASRGPPAASAKTLPTGHAQSV